MGVNRYGKETDRWVAFIWIKNKQINLGVFDTKAEAVAARKAAEKVEGYHENHGSDGVIAGSGGLRQRRGIRHILTRALQLGAKAA